MQAERVYVDEAALRKIRESAVKKLGYLGPRLERVIDGLVSRTDVLEHIETSTELAAMALSVDVHGSLKAGAQVAGKWLDKMMVPGDAKKVVRLAMQSRHLGTKAVAVGLVTVTFDEGLFLRVARVSERYLSGRWRDAQREIFAGITSAMRELKKSDREALMMAFDRSLKVLQRYVNAERLLEGSLPKPTALSLLSAGLYGAFGYNKNLAKAVGVELAYKHPEVVLTVAGDWEKRVTRINLIEEARRFDERGMALGRGGLVGELIGMFRRALERVGVHVVDNDHVIVESGASAVIYMATVWGDVRRHAISWKNLAKALEYDTSVVMKFRELARRHGVDYPEEMGLRALADTAHARPLTDHLVLYDTVDGKHRVWVRGTRFVSGRGSLEEALWQVAKFLSAWERPEAREIIEEVESAGARGARKFYEAVTSLGKAYGLLGDALAVEGEDINVLVLTPPERDSTLSEWRFDPAELVLEERMGLVRRVAPLLEAGRLPDGAEAYAVAGGGRVGLRREFARAVLAVAEKLGRPRKVYLSPSGTVLVDFGVLALMS